MIRTSTTLQQALVELHREILEFEREAHERAHGRVAPQAFLDSLLKDARFAWLKPLTSLTARDDPTPEEVRALLKPDQAGAPFQRRYAELLQQRPEVVAAHGAVMSKLRPGN